MEKNLESDPKIDVTVEKAFVEDEKSGLLLKSSTPEPILSLKKPLNDKIKNPDSDNESDSQSYSDSFESSEEDDKVVKEINIAKKNIKIKGARGRRESIEDVDNWFNNYSGSSEAVLHGKLSNIPEAPNYDAKQMYPFGNFDARRGSLSDEFFSCSNPISLTQKLSPEKEKVEPKPRAKLLKEAMSPKSLNKLEEVPEQIDELEKPACIVEKKKTKTAEPEKRISLTKGIVISWPQESGREDNDAFMDTSKSIEDHVSSSNHENNDSKSSDHSLLLKYFDAKN